MFAARRRAMIEWRYCTVELQKREPRTENRILALDLGVATINMTFLSCLLWAAILACLLFFRPGSRFMKTEVASIGIKGKACVAVIMALEIALCCFAMTLSPEYSGGNVGLAQYEGIADAFLQGQLHFLFEPDPRLAELNNVYDPVERAESGIPFAWDHAYYDGHYYMYFGVVPALLLFVPFKALTGVSLTAYHATQFFVAVIIAGFYRLFFRIAQEKFPRMPVPLFVVLAVGLTGASVWYIVAAPALYCTAIAAAICAMVLGFNLFLAAFRDGRSFAKTTVLAAGGSLCGALAFGCRPTIALSNVVVIAMLVQYLRNNHLSKGQLAILFAVGLFPYFAVAAGLCAYNYARFGNALEFGQAYQLTDADQHEYGFKLSRVNIPAGLHGLYNALFEFSRPTAEFPFLRFGGVFFMFPVLLVGNLLLSSRKGRGVLADAPVLLAMVTVLPISALLVVVLDLFMSPVWLTRYTMDVNWMFSIAAFAGIGAFSERLSETHRSTATAVAGVVLYLTALSCVLFFLVPYDGNATYWIPELLDDIARVATFGICDAYHPVP